MFKGIVPPYEKLILRGECSLNCPPEQLGYKNRRNGAAGLLKKESMVNSEFLTTFFYEAVEMIDHTTLDGVVVDGKPKLAFDQLNAIGEMGLNVVKHSYIAHVAEIPEVAKHIQSECENFNNDLYDADGKVICPNSYVWEDKHIPDQKIAFKINAEAIETTVNKIAIQVSRMGKLIPVVHYDPLKLGGATCSKATGFNYQFLNDNHIGIGSKIMVCRSEEVIPYIRETVAPTGCDLPSVCPECGGPVDWDANDVHIVCTNQLCPPQLIKNITHFFESLGLEEFGESSFEKLGVKSIQEVYELTYDDIKGMDGFGDKSAKDFVKRVKDTLNTRPEFLIRAFGIELIGKTASKLLTENYSWGTIKDVDFTSEELLKLPDVGPGTAHAIMTGLLGVQHLILDLEGLGMTVTTSSGNLAGKSFCATGKLEKMKRTQLERWVTENGGSICGIKKDPNMYLVCNKASTSAKYKKALSYGISIITEDQLFDMV
jgi:DNA ligase (NAD+)